MENLNDSSKRRVTIYIRVSTQEQKIDGYGLEAQRKRLKDYVENNKALNFVTKNEWIFTDTHTGSDLNREKLNDLMKGVREKKFDAVLVWKIDRLSRSLKHLLTLFEEFEKNEVSFISVQENIYFKGPIGKLIFQIFGAIAQFERELIKGRTNMGKITSAEMGNYTGTAIPYGYKPIPNPNGKGKKLETIPQEKKWVEEMFSWYIYEDMGFGQIAKKLNDLKVPKSLHSKAKDRLGQWTDTIVGNIIQNPIYRGEYVANRKDENGIVMPEDKWTIVSIPACVSEFTFQQAQNACKNKTGGKKIADYLLSSKLRDMTLTPSKGFVGARRFKGGFSYRRKQFDKDGVHYPVFEIPAKQIEDFVWQKIMDALKDPKIFIEHYLSKKYADPTKIAKLQNALSTLREAQMNGEVAIARIEHAYETGNYSEEKMQEKISEKNKSSADIENKIQEIEDELKFMSSIDIEVQKLKDASKQIKYRLEKLDHKQKKILVNLFIDRIEMFREKIGKRWKITAEIYFRFNPNKFPNTLIGGRTEKAPIKAINPRKVPFEGNSGAQGGT